MEETVRKILEEEMSGTHLFLVELEVKTSKIDVFVDGDAGVNISECAKLNNRLHRRLEEQGIDTGAYYIDVSSPGIDRSLKLIREYKKNVGRKLEMKISAPNPLKGEQISPKGELGVKGLLIYLDEEKIILKTGTGAKAVSEKIYFNEITEVQVII